jgi:hypothetical protein
MKQDDKLYFPTIISSMLHDIGWLIWTRKKQLIVEIDVTPWRLKFNILINICYQKTKLVVDEVIMQSIKGSLGHIITKNHILTLEQEALLLASNQCSLKIPQRLNNKFMYLCTLSFSFEVPRKWDK